MTIEFHRQLQIAEGYLQLGMPKEAITAVNEIDTDLQKRPEVIAVCAAITEFLKQWKQMAVLISSLVAAYPDEPKWWIKLADAMRHGVSVQASADVLLEAELNHPRNALIKYNLACCCCRLGKLDEAKSRLGVAIKLDRTFRKLAVDDPDLKALFGD